MSDRAATSPFTMLGSDTADACVGDSCGVELTSADTRVEDASTSEG